MKRVLISRGLWLVMVLLLCQPGLRLEAQAAGVNSLEFINYNLRDTFRNLAAVGGFRILLGQAVHGEVSVVVQPGMSPKEAISAVASAYGYSIQWVSASPETAIVGASRSAGEDWQEKRFWQTLTYNYLTASRVTETLTAVIPRIYIQPDLKENRVAVFANHLEYQNLSEIIAESDQLPAPEIYEIWMLEIPPVLWNTLGITRNPARNTAVYPLTSGQLKQVVSTAGITPLLQQMPYLPAYNEEQIFVGDVLPVIAETKEKGLIRYRINYQEAGSRLTFRRLPAISALPALAVGLSVSGPGLRREHKSWVRFDKDGGFLLTGTPGREELRRLGATPDSYPVLHSIYDFNASVGKGKETVWLITMTDLTETVETDLAVTATSSPSPSPAVSGAPGEIMAPEGLLTGESKPEVDLEGSVAIPTPMFMGTKTLHLPDPGMGCWEIRYAVKKTDTINGIIKKFGADKAELIIKNKLGNVGIMKTGTVLIVSVPLNRIYYLKPKETLWRIAHRYRTSLQVLQDLNGIKDVTKVPTGQPIILPVPADRPLDLNY